MNEQRVSDLIEQLQRFDGQPSTGRGLETGVLKADKTEQTVFKRPAVILFPI